MSFTNIIQVAIGLMLVYYALGLMVNIFVAMMKDVFDIRAESLEAMLKAFFEAGGSGNKLYREFNEHALIQNLKPITNKALQWKNRTDPKVEKIANDTFSLALLDVLASRGRVTDFVRAAVERLIKVETEPRTQELLRQSLQFGDDDLEDGLRSTASKLSNGPVKERLEDLIDLLLGKPATQLQIIRASVEELPDGKTKEALLSLINLSKGDVDELRRRLESWYDDTMKNAALLYRKQVRWVVVAASFIFTFAIGADSIRIVQDLWQQPLRQSAIIEQLAPLVDEFGKAVIDLEKWETLSQTDKERAIEGHVDDLVSIVNWLQGLTDVSVTWRNPWPLAEENWEGGILIKLAGLIITAVATSQGSSFWYDILKKINPRTAAGSCSGPLHYAAEPLP